MLCFIDTIDVSGKAAEPTSQENDNTGNIDLEIGLETVIVGIGNYKIKSLYNKKDNKKGGYQNGTTTIYIKSC